MGTSRHEHPLPEPPLPPGWAAGWDDIPPPCPGGSWEDRFAGAAAALAGTEAPLGFASLYVTAKCPFSCIHCHAQEEFAGTGPDGEVPTSVLLEVILKLAQVAQRIQLTGGDPFTRRAPGAGHCDVPLLVRAITALGREPILQTTGITLSPRSCAWYREHGVRWAAISLDGPTPALNAVIRGRDSAYGTALRAIAACREAGISVKVGTVVTRPTLDHDAFFELGALLAGMDVQVWKLMHFFPRAAGRASAANADRLAITPDEFTALLTACRDRFAFSGMEVAGHDLDTFGTAPALLVQPTGAVTVTSGIGDVPLGNVLTMDRAQMLDAVAAHTGTVNANLANTYREARR